MKYRFAPHDGPARIPPITPAEYDDEVRAFLAQVEGPGGRKAGSSLNVIRTLANNPELGSRYFNFGAYILRFSTLTERVRELVTLRTAWLYECEYEWEKHLVKALAAGITEAEVEAITQGPQAATWSDSDRSLLEATDGMIRHNRISDATWAGLERDLDKKGLLDLMFTISSYAMLAMVLKGLRIPLEDE